MTNKEKALALIETFATGDTKKQRNFLQRTTFSTILHMEQERMPL